MVEKTNRRKKLNDGRKALMVNKIQLMGLEKLSW